METGDNEVPQIGSCLVFIEGSIFSRFCTYHMKNKVSQLQVRIKEEECDTVHGPLS